MRAADIFNGIYEGKSIFSLLFTPLNYATELYFYLLMGLQHMCIRLFKIPSFKHL